MGHACMVMSQESREEQSSMSWTADFLFGTGIHKSAFCRVWVYALDGLAAFAAFAAFSGSCSFIRYLISGVQLF